MDYIETLEKALGRTDEKGIGRITGNKGGAVLDIKKILKENLPPMILEPLKKAYSDMHYAAMHVVPEEWYLKRKFKKQVGYPLNLDNPRTFNEKLQWLKLRDHNPLYTKMVDKYEAKKYVAELIGEEYIIPTLGLWNHFDEIAFDTLPNQFVLKCTHDSGSIVICKDKNTFDKQAAKKKLERGLRYNYYYRGGFEWPYKNVKPRIIAEKYMVDESQTELKDYKIMCFNGQAKCSFVCTGRGSSQGLRVTFYDSAWQKMPFSRHYPIELEPVVKPHNYEKMMYLAEKISAHLKFARIDFYEVIDKIYFGEITFFPGSGYEEFEPCYWDGIIGDWIKV